MSHLIETNVSNFNNLFSQSKLWKYFSLRNKLRNKFPLDIYLSRRGRQWWTAELFYQTNNVLREAFVRRGFEVLDEWLLTSPEPYFTVDGNKNKDEYYVLIGI